MGVLQPGAQVVDFCVKVCDSHLAFHWVSFGAGNGRVNALRPSEQGRPPIRRRTEGLEGAGYRSPEAIPNAHTSRCRGNPDPTGSINERH
jgi:hypothetical protein